MKNVIGEILEGQKIGLIDVGASGGLEKRWRPFEKHLQCFLFEPDQRSSEELVSDDNKIVFPIALSNKRTTLNLNLCRKPQVSSIYAPNRDFLDLFSDKTRWDILDTIELKATPLDTVISDQNTREKCDFIKLDTQGSELLILEGASETLSSIVGIECEVEFLPLYEGQPLFGEVSSYLSQHGFSLIDFMRLVKWPREGYESNRGQLVFADALFLKPPEKVICDLTKDSSLKPENVKSKILRYIAILSIYDQTDWVSFIYDHYGKEFNLHRPVKPESTEANKKNVEVSLSRFARVKNLVRKVIKKVLNKH